MAIRRVRHGRTPPDNGDSYWNILRAAVIRGIEEKEIEVPDARPNPGLLHRSR